MSSSRQYAIRRFLGFVCLLIIVTSTLALLGWPPTRRLAGAQGVRALLAGVAICWFASLVSGLPVLIAGLRGRQARVQEIVGALAIRFLLVLSGTFYVLLNGLAVAAPLIVWVGLSYLSLLPIDVWYLLRSNRANGPSD